MNRTRLVRPAGMLLAGVALAFGAGNLFADDPPPPPGMLIQVR